MKCQEEYRCRSFNYQHRGPSGSVYHICEINSITRDFDSSRFYHYRKSFTYYEVTIRFVCDENLELVAVIKPALAPESCIFDKRVKLWLI